MRSQKNLVITRKVLCRLTGATVNQVAYLKDMNKLPVLRETTGPGDANIYAPEAVEVVKTHLLKQQARK